MLRQLEEDEVEEGVKEYTVEVRMTKEDTVILPVHALSPSDAEFHAEVSACIQYPDYIDYKGKVKK